MNRKRGGSGRTARARAIAIVAVVLMAAQGAGAKTGPEGGSIGAPYQTSGTSTEGAPGDAVSVDAATGEIEIHLAPSCVIETCGVVSEGPTHHATGWAASRVKLSAGKERRSADMDATARFLVSSATATPAGSGVVSFFVKISSRGGYKECGSRPIPVPPAWAGALQVVVSCQATVVGPWIEITPRVSASVRDDVPDGRAEQLDVRVTMSGVDLG